MTACLVCQRQEAYVGKVANMDAYAVECELCGEFTIAGVLPRIWKTLDKEDKDLIPYLSAYIKEENRKGNKPEITIDNWKNCARVSKATPYREKIKKFLRLIEVRAHALDEFVPIDASVDYPLCDLGSANELSVLEKDAEENGYVEFQKVNGRCYRLKAKGRELLSAEKELEMPPPRQQLGDFVNSVRLSELKIIPKKKFDLTKLIRICEELNLCFRNECCLAVAALTRALLDHVPPIFNCGKFAEVANNYGGAKSFKESMKHLEESARKIGDAHLHVQIRGSETLPTLTQVDFRNDIDVLLGEIVRLLKS